MTTSYGFIETKGLVGAVEAADAMLKTANVKIIGYRQIGGGLVTVIIEGDLAACQAAVDAGGAAAERIGELFSVNIIARPLEDAEIFVSQNFSKKTSSQDSAAEINNQTRQAEPQKEPKPVARRKGQKTAVKLTKVQSESEILALLKKNPKGLTLQQITKQTKEDPVNIRILVKKLIEAEKIDKIQNRYYICRDSKR